MPSTDRIWAVGGLWFFLKSFIKTNIVSSSSIHQYINITKSFQHQNRIYSHDNSTFLSYIGRHFNFWIKFSLDVYLLESTFHFIFVNTTCTCITRKRCKIIENLSFGIIFIVKAKYICFQVILIHDIFLFYRANITSRRYSFVPLTYCQIIIQSPLIRYP